MYKLCSPIKSTFSDKGNPENPKKSFCKLCRNLEDCVVLKHPEFGALSSISPHNHNEKFRWLSETIIHYSDLLKTPEEASTKLKKMVQELLIFDLYGIWFKQYFCTHVKIAKFQQCKIFTNPILLEEICTSCYDGTVGNWIITS